MAVQQGGFGLSGDGGGGGQPTVNIDEQAFNGAVMNHLNIPSRAVAGKTIRISGVAGLDCPICSVGREVRIVLDASHLSEPRIDNVGILSGRGQTAQFEFEIPAPQTEGQVVNIRLHGERNPPVGGWERDNSRGPFEVNIVSQAGDVVQEATEVAPWAVGGGAVGVGAARALDRHTVGGGLVGAGVGVSTKLIADQVLGSGDLFDFPTVPVVATAGLLGAGAYLLAQVRGLSPV